MEQFPGLKAQLLSQPFVLYDASGEDTQVLDFRMDPQQKFIFTAISAVVIGVGLLCNTAIPIVLTFRKKYCKSLNIFFMYINIVNSISLIFGATQFLFYLNKVNIWLVDPISCKYSEI